MNNAGHSDTNGLHLALYQVFKYLASIVRYLPNSIASPFLVLLRVIFVAVLGFAAWVRSFSDSSLGLWLSIGVVFCLLAHMYVNRACLFPDEKCKVENMKNEITKEWLQSELETQKNMYDTLEQVRETLESKTRLEQEADTVYERWKTHLQRSDDKIENLQKQLNDFSQEKILLEEQLEQKTNEIDLLKSTFEKNLAMLTENIESIKQNEAAKKRMEDMATMEKFQRMEDENSILRATVDALTRQRRSLSNKHTNAVREKNNIAHIKKELENQLLTKEQLEQAEKEKLSQVQKLAQKLNMSLSNAKGKLNQGKNLVEDENRKISQEINPNSTMAASMMRKT